MTQEVMKDADSSLRGRFEELREQLEQATMFLSDPRVWIAHPAHKAIVALGMPVVPLLLRDLRLYRTHWFWALREITGEDPIPRAHWGRVALMAEDWLSWGRERNVLPAGDDANPSV